MLIPDVEIHIHFSGGQRQRFLLALALIKQYNPEMTIVLPKERLGLSPDNLNLPFRIVRDRIELKTKDVNSCLNHLLSHHIDLTDLTVRSPNLETVFLNLTGRHLRE